MRGARYGEENTDNDIRGIPVKEPGTLCFPTEESHGMDKTQPAPASAGLLMTARPGCKTIGIVIDVVQNPARPKINSDFALPPLKIRRRRRRMAGHILDEHEPFSLVCRVESAWIVDIGCGHGRHAVALAQRGANVVGMDSAAALLTEARQLSSQAGVPPQWVRGDMRQSPFPAGLFQAAMLLDAFGFFAAEQDNELALAELSRVLAPGGRLCLKIVNGEPVLADFRSHDHEEREGSFVTISRTLDLNPPRMTEHIRVMGRRGNGEYERRQRLYRSDELSAALDRVGFSILAISATANGLPFEPVSSATMWFFCERKTI